MDNEEPQRDDMIWKLLKRNSWLGSIVLALTSIVLVSQFFVHYDALNWTKKPKNIVTDNSQKTEQEDPKVATLLIMNDIYRINGIRRGEEGGIARITSIRKELEASNHDVLVLHAGDALSPSLLGDMFEGAQMVDTMNLLDRSDSFDDRFFVTFGNHEFDNSSCTNPLPLVRRVAESDFTWLSGNLDFNRCAKGTGFAPIARSENVMPTKIVSVGGIRFGLFGLTLRESEYSDLLTDQTGDTGENADQASYINAAKRLATDLRAQGAEYVIAVTHLEETDDRAILKETNKDNGPDLIVGGHDHMIAEAEVKGRYVFKQTADALNIGIIKFIRDGNGIITFDGRKSRTLAQNTPPKDGVTQRRVDFWLAEHEKAFCKKKKLKENCLSDPMGETAVEWKLEEYSNREKETAIGNWLSDQMLSQDLPNVGDCRAGVPTVGILAAGGLRLNYNVPAKFDLQRREIEELFPFSQKLVALCISKDQLYAALANGLAASGAGRWPHISGMSVDYSFKKNEDKIATIHEVKVSGKAIAEKGHIRVIVNSYTASRGDGYTMWPVCTDIPIDRSGGRKECEERILDGKEPLAVPLKDAEGKIFNLKPWILDKFEREKDQAVGPLNDLEENTRRLTNRKAL